MDQLIFPIRSDKLSMNVQIEEHLCSIQSPYQKIDIYKTLTFGKILFLDGHVQLATLDEFAYHESLVHVPLLNLQEPRSALVVGGGDGGVLRELCRNRSLQTIDIVEIDAQVIQAAKSYILEISDGAFDDPRVTLTVGDAFEFLKSPAKLYDIIVMDSTDVYEEEDGGLSKQLFTGAFYQDCARALTPGGFLVTQADNLLFCPYSLDEILGCFGSVFPSVGSYWALVPSFGGFSGFAWASKEGFIGKTWPTDADSMRYLNRATYEMGQGDLPFGLV